VNRVLLWTVHRAKAIGKEPRRLSSCRVLLWTATGAGNFSKGTPDTYAADVNKLLGDARMADAQAIPYQ